MEGPISAIPSLCFAGLEQIRGAEGTFWAVNWGFVNPENALRMPALKSLLSRGVFLRALEYNRAQQCLY